MHTVSYQIQLKDFEGWRVKEIITDADTEGEEISTFARRRLAQWVKNRPSHQLRLILITQSLVISVFDAQGMNRIWPEEGVDIAST